MRCAIRPSRCTGNSSSAGARECCRVGYRTLDVAICLLCCAACRAVCDFFNCCEIALALVSLVSRAYPGSAPLIGGRRVLQLCDGAGWKWNCWELRQPDSLGRHAGAVMDRV